MALESATYVSDLVATNPTSSDPKSQGDDHLRMVKSVLQTTFPAGSEAHYPTKLASYTATTSGTSVDFTSIPSWAKKITVLFVEVSTNGTSNPLVQIGDAGGVEASGYLGVGVGIQNGSSPSTSGYTTGFGLPFGNAGNTLSGAVVLTLANASANTWVCSGNIAQTASNTFGMTSGAKSLSATLDRVRITTVNGTDAFDAGAVNLLIE